MQRTKAELIAQNSNLIYQNSNEAITGAILNSHLRDFIDSFSVEFSQTGEAFTINQYHTYIVPDNTNLNCVITLTPSNEVNVFVNGIKYKVGSTDSAPFFFKSSLGQIRDNDAIEAGDILNYNPLGTNFYIDTADYITINYITSAI